MTYFRPRVLVGKGQSLDAQEVWIAQEPLQIEAQGVRRQLRIQPRAEAGKAMRMVVLQMELLAQLAIDRLHDRPSAVMQAAEALADRLLLVLARQGDQFHPPLVP